MYINILYYILAGGVAYCAYSTSVGSTYYVTVINADSSVDFSNSFRFTCYVSARPPRLNFLDHELVR